MLKPGIVVAGTLAAALAYELCAGRVLFGALVLFPFVSRLCSLFLAPKLVGAWKIALPFGPITVVARLPSRMTWGPVCAVPWGTFEGVTSVWGVGGVTNTGAAGADEF